MIAIAESGSTKTEWVVLDGKKTIHHFVTSGMNPVIQTRDEIETIIQDEVSNELKKFTPEKLFYYGTACSSTERVELMKILLKSPTNIPYIEVEHDLLAAARGLFIREKGIAAILGTGSNSCVYDDQTIVENTQSIGYILGDEGSGMSIGKVLLRDYVYGALPHELKIKLQQFYPNLSKEEILKMVYTRPSPNRWIAGFAKFVSENINEEYCTNLVSLCFREFIENQVIPYGKEIYQTHPFGVVGSIGFYHQELFKTLAKEYDIKVEKVLQNALDGLIKYHTT